MAEPASSISPSGLGVSGFYDDADGVVFNPIHDDNVDNTRETIQKETPPRITESGDYTSRIESSYQVDNDLKGSLKSPRVDYVHTEETSKDISDNGLRSSHTVTEQTRTDSGGFIPSENVTIFKDSWKPDDRGSGIYSTKIESTEHDNRQSMQNSDDHSRSSRISQSRRLGATTLSTMTEEDENALYPRDRSDMRSSWARNSRESSTDNYNYNSNSMEKNGAPPVWTEMIFNPGFNEAYLQRAWPRIALQFQRSNRPSDPFVPGDHEDLDNLKKPKKDCSIFLKCWIWWTVVVLAVGITVVVIFMSQTKDPPSATKNYVKVDMNMTVDETYLPKYNDNSSSEYKAFTTEFCDQVTTAYKNSTETATSYYGCIVTGLSSGSIIVTYTIYFVDTSKTAIETSVIVIIKNTIQSNGNKLGQWKISVNLIYVESVITETLVTSPSVQENPTTTTTTTTTEAATALISTDNPTTMETTTADVSSTTASTTTKIISSTDTDTTTKMSSTVGVSDTRTTVTESATPITGSTSASTLSITQTTYMPTTTTDVSTADTSTSSEPQSPGSRTTLSTLGTESTIKISEQNSTFSQGPTFLPSVSTAGTPTTKFTDESTISYMPTKSDQVSSESSTVTGIPTSQTSSIVTESKTTHTQSTSTVSTTKQTTSIVTETTPPAPSTVTEPTSPPAPTTVSEPTNPSVSSTVTEPTSPSAPSTVSEPTNSPGSSTVTEPTSPSAPSTVSEPTNSPASSTVTKPTTLSTTESTATQNPTTVTEPTTQKTTPFITVLTSREGPSTVTETTSAASPAASESTSYQTPSVTAEPTSTVSETTTPLNPSTTTPFTTQETTPTVTETTLGPTTVTESTTSQNPSIVTDTTTPQNPSTVTKVTTPETPTTVTETTPQNSPTVTETTSWNPSSVTESTTPETSTTLTETTTPQNPSTMTVVTTQEPPSTTTEQTTSQTLSTATEPTSPPSSTSVTESTTTQNPSTITELTTETTVSTTESTTDLTCPVSKTLQLYEGPVDVFCSVSEPEAFDIIHIYHNEGHANPESLFDVKYHKNGTVLESGKTNDAINFVFSNDNLTLTFQNVSCLFEGKFSMELLQDSALKSKKEINIEVKGTPGTPSLTLNADQVVDFAFPDGNFYRTDRTHKCVGTTGYPPSNLQIDITYDNGTSYQPIAADKFVEVSRNNISSGCITTETVEFAMQYTQEMHRKARIRCYIQGDIQAMTLSDELLLIPRNICNCGENDYRRGHPDICNVYVECKKDSSGIYPLGVACPESQCRISDTGECTANCSSAVCDEKPPDDFCLPTPAPTTEEPPSPYASCQDKVIEFDEGLATITCTLNGTAYSSLNITSRSSAGGQSIVIAQISDTDMTTDLLPDDDVSVNLDGQIISVTINNPSCTTGDFYGVDVIVDNTVVGSSSGKLIVGKRPTETPVLYLHPDQISGLNDYHNWLLHSCDAGIGFPAGDIFVEIMRDIDTGFAPLTVHIERTNSTQVDSCTFRKKIEFGIKFTSDMDNAIIRCGVRNENLNNFTRIYSNNDTVTLIPSTFCDINSSGGTVFYPHLSDCHSYIQCEGTSTYSKPCNTGLCFGVESVNSCNFCNQVTCPADVTTTMPTIAKTTTEEANIDNYLKCEDTKALIFSENVDIVCFMNITLYEFVRVSFTASVDNQLVDIADVFGPGNVIYPTNRDDNFEVQVTGTALSVTVKNVTCSYNGEFKVSVNMSDSLLTDIARLQVTVEPSGQASLTMHPEQIIGYKREGSLHVCEADVGNPPGQISIEIRLQGETSYTNMTNLNEMGETNTLSQCSYKKTYNFLVDFTPEMENATVRCSVRNKNFNSLPPIFSNSEKLALVPGDFCDDKNDTRYHHPTDQECRRYVWCTQLQLFIVDCKSLCFDQNAGVCVRCDDASTCPFKV